jgi:hypothetical protein
MQVLNQIPLLDITRGAPFVESPPNPLAPLQSRQSRFYIPPPMGQTTHLGHFCGRSHRLLATCPASRQDGLGVHPGVLQYECEQSDADTLPPLPPPHTHTNEGDIKDRQCLLVPHIHNYTAVGENYAPRPLDFHSRMAHINPRGHTNLTVNGSPDFVFSRTRNNVAFQAWHPFAVLGEVNVRGL